MPTSEALLTQLGAETTSMTAQLQQADLGTSVRSCPGWDVRRLVRHLGRVHRWATEIVRTGQEAEGGRPPDGDDAALLAWFDQGAQELVATLTAADPDAPCWTFGPQPQLTAFWIRRQAHETAMHHWDAATALGHRVIWPDWFAEDAVDEVCRMFFPRQVRLGRQPALTDSLTLVSTATEHAWTLAGDGRSASSGDPDATASAPAATLELLLWHRTDVDDPEITVTGDAQAAHRVLASALTP